MSNPKDKKKTRHKPTQKVVNFGHRGISLRVYDLVITPYRIWHEFHEVRKAPSYTFLNVSYRPPLKVIQVGEKEYAFFDNFRQAHLILNHDDVFEQPCLVYRGSPTDITLVAWQETFDLVYQRNINHASFHQRLVKEIAVDVVESQTILKAFLGMESLSIDAYCNFAGINRATYNYQKNIASREVENTEQRLKQNRLPRNEEWLNE